MRRRVRSVVLVIGALTLIVLLYFFGRPVRERVEIIMAQRRCAAGLLQPDQVTFEEDPTRALSLKNSGKEYVAAGSGRLKQSAVLPTPAPLVSYPGNRLQAAKSLGRAPLFIGRRNDDSGESAIIYMSAGLGMTPGPQFCLTISYWCDPIAPWSLAPLQTPLGGQSLLGAIGLSDDQSLWQLKLHRSLTLHAGVPDPTDAQRFTVRYALDGKLGTIEFRYRHNGRIDRKILDGPLLPEQAQAWLTATTAPAK